MSTRKSSSSNSINESGLNSVIETVSDYSDRAVNVSRDAVERSVEVAKEYPVHTALGAGAIGFLAGLIINKILK